MNPFWKDKKVFITGSTGFIGSWLTKRLVDLGAQVAILFYESNFESELVRSGYIKKVRIVKGLLQDYSILEKIIYENGIDTVLHLGAQTQVVEAILNPLETYESNVRGTYSLLEACRIHRKQVKRIVVASSDKAYGTSTILPYVEETPLRAVYPYDVSKACTDLIALSYYHTYGLPIVVSRCGNVYGGGDFNWDRLIPSVIKSFYDEISPRLRSNGESLRDYVFVEDIVNAYLMLGEQLEAKHLEGQAFNFSANQPKTVLEVVHLIGRFMKKDHLKPIIINEAQREIKNQYLNSEKAEKILNWKPYFNLNLGLQLTIDWYQNFFKHEKKSLVKAIK